MVASSVSWRGIGVAPALEIDAFPEPLEQLLRGEDRHAPGRELEREREVVEARTEPPDRARLRKRRSQGAARAVNRAVPSCSSIDGTIHACSPATAAALCSSRGASRLQSGGRRAMSVATRGSRCSALSISRSARFVASASTSVSPSVKAGALPTSSAFATASSASAGSRSAASEIHQAPSGTSSAISAAACSASRVFPVRRDP